MERIDTLINARWVIPVEPDCEAEDHHSIAIRGGKIVGLLPTAQAADRYEAEEVIDRPRHALMPGLVNAHTHAAMSLLRGLADDLPLMNWLKDHIWPAESRWVSAEFVADGTELAIAEMLRGGTTCFNDMYFFPDVVARTASRLGIRVCAGLIVLDFPSAWADSPDEYLSKGLELHDEYKAHPLVTTGFAPHAPYTVADQPLERLRKLSDELDAPVHVHLHETVEEIRQSQERYGERPIERFQRLGLISPLLAAVHMTQLEESDLALIAEARSNVVHCPESNLKLASGLCPVARLIDAGINVAIGTDGAASNNDLDMIGEMRTAALIGKLAADSAEALTARDVIRMATLNGARTLGLGDETGSLVPGKWADVICIDMARLNTEPVYDPVSQIVYAASRDQVVDVWVGGHRLLVDGVLERLDEDAVLERARSWQRLISESTEH
ncbi:MAG: TRZ/ATZ family hydrolase [Chromatiales bacterium]|jgi:5-methylthioadenosine/S-adenosylhomocysteine deaminase|nr:TRZ/ATZ family hydrolase [Chromatiales bacterium]